ncbi:hypothetical protein GYMLUDRAFT_243799 [Collybiopsis luxurians FD-317 M1]|uniref:Uncharacterized protein n=1 Tax=Collybiopsis luxurians FD-317 M1 TaxID=944289 RepID=A0A0D0BZ39_9AGAR|nr:hypothetical protein GYMLUDRAFT_243799 [Collybiopsis luxurians FD-317 M1]
MQPPQLAWASTPSITTIPSSDFSTATSISSVSTFVGHGSLSGKLIYKLGKLALKGVENVVISRRLSSISSHFPHKRLANIPELNEMYRDLLELSRPGLYLDSYRIHSLQLLMAQISFRHTAELVKALSTWPLIELRLLLSDLTSRIDPTRSYDSAVYLDDPVILEYQKYLSKWEGHSLTPLIDFLSALVASSSHEVREILDSGVQDLLLHIYVSDFRDPLVLDHNETLYVRKSSLAAACNTFLLGFEGQSGGFLANRFSKFDRSYPFGGLWSIWPWLSFGNMNQDR